MNKPTLDSILLQLQEYLLKPRYRIYKKSIDDSTGIELLALTELGFPSLIVFYAYLSACITEVGFPSFSCVLIYVWNFVAPVIQCSRQLCFQCELGRGSAFCLQAYATWPIPIPSLYPSTNALQKPCRNHMEVHQIHCIKQNSYHLRISGYINLWDLYGICRKNLPKLQNQLSLCVNQVEIHPSMQHFLHGETVYRNNQSHCPQTKTDNQSYSFIFGYILQNIDVPILILTECNDFQSFPRPIPLTGESINLESAHTKVI